MSGYSFSLPASAGTPIAGSDNPTSELLGEDILFTDDFQMGAQGDTLVITGDEVVRQAIYRRLWTNPGELAFRPEYGCGVRQAVKKKLTKSTMDALHQRIVDNLAQEDRIDKVVEVVLQTETRDGKPVLKIYVKAQIAGRVQSFKPFVFVQSS